MTHIKVYDSKRWGGIDIKPAGYLYKEKTEIDVLSKKQISIVYNAAECNQNTKRMRRYRAVKRLCTAIGSETDISCLFWEALKSYEGYTFQTINGLHFTYTIRGNEMFTDRKKKSITRASADRTLQNAIESGSIVDGRFIPPMVSGPKKLGTFGASYIYPILLHMKLICGSEKV